MISNFREGGRFSKIGESLCKKAFSIGEKSEIGRRGGVKNDPKKIDIIYGWPLSMDVFSNVDLIFNCEEWNECRFPRKMYLNTEFVHAFFCYCCEILTLEL